MRETMRVTRDRDKLTHAYTAARATSPDEVQVRLYRVWDMTAPEGELREFTVEEVNSVAERCRDLGFEIGLETEALLGPDAPPDPRRFLEDPETST